MLFSLRARCWSPSALRVWLVRMGERSRISSWIRLEPTSGFAPEGSRVQDGALADEHMGNEVPTSARASSELQRKESNLRVTG